MDKKYGLWTSTAMVVGIVIGSGIFFKTTEIIKASNNNIIIGLIALIIGALAMIFGSQVFGNFAQKIEKTNGIIDYTEYAFGKKIGYLVGFYKSIIYLPSLVAVLSWVSARYTLVLFNLEAQAINSIYTWLLALVYLIIFFLLNFISPILSGKFQISSTLIKLIPILFIGLICMVIGLFNGITFENYREATRNFSENSSFKSIFNAVVITSFAYEGWIIATSINHEIKNSQKNLPKALFLGTLTIAFLYILFYIGITFRVPVNEINDNSVKIISIDLFQSTIGGTVIMVFIVISCLGTLNGLILGAIRSPYSVAVRNNHPFSKKLAVLNKNNMPLYSAIYAFGFSVLMLVVWYANFNNWFSFLSVFGTTFLDISVIPIAFIYFFYIALYIWYMLKSDSESFYKRYIIPGLAIFGSLFILIGAFTNRDILLGMILSPLILLLGLVFYKKDSYV